MLRHQHFFILKGHAAQKGQKFDLSPDLPMTVERDISWRQQLNRGALQVFPVPDVFHLGEHFVQGFVKNIQLTRMDAIDIDQLQ